MTQSDQKPHKHAPRDPKASPSNTGATVGAGYEDKQGDYPAYTGRVAEATEDSDDTAKKNAKQSTS